MKLLHVIPSMNPLTGGPCQGIRNLHASCENLGMHCEIVSVDDPDDEFLKHDPLVIHAVGPAKSSLQYSKNLIPWLLQNLLKYDAVIVNGIWSYHSFATRKAVNKLKEQSRNGIKIPKIFIMPHGMLDPYFQQSSDRKLKALRNWFYWKLVEQKNIKEADGLFFTCDAELQLAQKTFTPYAPRQQINVSYGVDVMPPYKPEMKTRFLEKCPGLKDSPYFLYLSRIHPKKGTDILIDAYIRLFNSYKNENNQQQLPKLVIAGPGIDTTYGRKIKEHVLKQENDVQAAIHFIGMVTDDAKAGAIWGCEAFVLPSHQENFGIAVVEALSCFKPVLISNKINIYYEIIQAGAGFASADTLEGTLGLLMRWVAMTEAEKKQMQQKAGECFAANFAIEKAANTLFTTLNEQFTHSQALR